MRWTPVAGGALGGLAGVWLGQLAVRLSYRLTGDAGLWFKGPHGPPFFDLMLHTAVFYAGVGAGVYQGKRRIKGAGLGFAAAFLGILLPMGLATRVFSWGESGAVQPTYAWFNLVIGTYLCASALAVCLLGARAQPEGPRLRAGLGALGGAFAAYTAGLGLFALFPQLRGNPLAALGFFPPAGLIIDGALSGGGIGAGILLATRRKNA